MAHTNHILSKRKVFVASSSEHGDLAKAVEHFIKDEFNEKFDCSAWVTLQDKAGQHLIERVRKWVREFHVGIFILAPDDLRQKPHPELLNYLTRNPSFKKHIPRDIDDSPVPRDNVVFELGGWVAFAGVHRAYILQPKSPHRVKVPSDFESVVSETYDYDLSLLGKSVPQIAQALGPSVRKIFEAITTNDDERAEDRFRESIEELQERIKKEAAQDPFEAVKHLCLGLRTILSDKVISFKGNTPAVANYLNDLLLWMKTSLDALDHVQLARAQDAATKEVWVYAPKPLEAERHARANDVLQTVANNLSSEVDYYYFVENQEDGIPRILELAKRFNPSTNSNWDEKLRKHLKIVVLRQRLFMTYYTVHFDSAGGEAVFQSIVRDNREDLLIRLDSVHAKEVKDMIGFLLDKARLNVTSQDGFTIYTLHPKTDELTAPP